jgi:5-oxoprolinase (ATP-hydrolysing) subunit A
VSLGIRGTVTVVGRLDHLDPTSGAGEAVAIDLNSDVGELADPAIDTALLQVVTSANIACGGHAGDETSMDRVCALAMSQSVVIGAQVSYPDRVGFGRRRLDLEGRELHVSLAEQYDALDRIAQHHGSRVSYIKPHGALYHAALDDAETAEVLLELAAGRGVPLLTMSSGELATRADRYDVTIVHEAFVDRGYTADGRLTPRAEPGALLDHADALDRLAYWARTGFAGARSLCIHSDTPDAVDLAHRVNAALHDLGVALQPFAGGWR